MKRVLLFCFSVLFALVIPSCEKSIIDSFIEEDGLPDVELRKEIVPIYNAPTMILGDVIDIPYTIDNLLNAYQYLDPATKAGINPDDIVVTHVYVKFSPKNEEELSVLKNDKDLILFEYPLDREILAYSRSYHDPEVPADMPTYQYCVIPIDYWEELAPTVTVSYEILLKVYMPDDYYYEVKSSTSCYDQLLATAYRLSGLTYTPATKASWTPEGTITTYDQIYAGQVPVPYVRVRGRHLLRVSEALTNSVGYYIFSHSFSAMSEMSIVWESDDWDIRDGETGQATLHKTFAFGSNWNVSITGVLDGYAQLHFSAIQRAAYRMYYGYNFGLTRPGNQRKEKISYIEDVMGVGVHGSYIPQIGATVVSDIRIAGKYSTQYYYNTAEVYSATCHELTHATQYINASSSYSSNDRKCESWARGVQILLTRKEYSDLNCESNLFTYSIYNGITYEEPDNYMNFQLTWNQGSPYTSVIVDLFDDFNQHQYALDKYYYTTPDPAEYPDDTISDFPPPIIESYVFLSDDCADVKQYLKTYATNNPNNTYGLTSASVDAIFLPYGD